MVAKNDHFWTAILLQTIRKLTIIFSGNRTVSVIKSPVVTVLTLGYYTMIIIKHAKLDWYSIYFEALFGNTVAVQKPDLSGSGMV
jgi:hypothetical protein